MAELNIPRAHSDSWYDQLAERQEGYYYPWRSTVGNRNGEQAFMALMAEFSGNDLSVLEAGCGHGELALSLASGFNHVTAYDRVGSYIDLANEAQAQQHVSNVTFLHYDPTQQEMGDVVLPVEDDSVDLIICRRGPLHWIDDVVRVCRDGAWIVALNPMEEPIPAWSSKLPHVLHYENSGRHTGSGSIHQSVENRLHRAGLTLHSGWGFDVPEVFSEMTEFYTMLTWGLPVEEIPVFEDIEYKLQGIFERYAEPDGIVLRHCRFMWQAQVHKAG